jgi:uncharacterized protein YidB (DUF937 family)
MGLLDILNGMQNGPRGGSAPEGNPKSDSSMSPITMAILGMLAYKAFKHLSGGNAQTAPANTAPANDGKLSETASTGGGGLGDILGGMLNGPRGGPSAGGTAGGGLGDLLGGMLGGGRGAGAGGAAGGGLGDLLKGGLGGILAGGAAGSVLSGGLDDLMKQLQQNGHKDAADSWVGKGENKQIAPNDLASALGADELNFMSQQSGLPREELLQQLSQHLPEFINQATPDGRVPTEEEAKRFI